MTVLVSDMAMYFLFKLERIIKNEYFSGFVTKIPKSNCNRNGGKKEHVATKRISIATESEIRSCHVFSLYHIAISCIIRNTVVQVHRVVFVSLYVPSFSIIVIVDVSWYRCLVLPLPVSISDLMIYLPIDLVVLFVLLLFIN